MTAYRTLAAATAALLVAGFVGLGAFGQVRPGDRPGVGKEGTTRQESPAPFAGRITRLDVTGRTMSVEYPVDGELGTAAGKVKTKKANNNKATGSGKEMRFSIADRVKVTLDGKAGTLNDLKVGHYARVYTGKTLDGTPGLGRDAGDERGDLTRRDAGRDTRIGRSTSAWKIEAFTKAPKVTNKTKKTAEDNR
jgi:hypothetical protein